MNSTKPRKPYDTFPLFPHSKGYWAKKIAGRQISFGKWAWPDQLAFEASWRAALERYKVYAEAVAVGGTDALRLTVPELVRCWRARISKRCLAREISARHAGDCVAVAEDFAAAVGNVRVADLERRPGLLGKYASNIESCGWHVYNRRVVILKSMFTWAAHPIEGPLKRRFTLANSLARRPIKLLRRQKREREAVRGKQCWTPTEFSALLSCASPIMRAWLLLGYFCAYGNSDLADLPRSAITEIGNGWGVIHFPRPKTEVERAAVVPPVVMDALREVAPLRPSPADKRWAGLVFLTPDGFPLVRELIDLDVAKSINHVSAIDTVSHLFGQYRDSVCHCSCGSAMHHANGARCSSCAEELLPIRKLGFYTFRHTAITAASGSVDADAVHRWRGHALRGMSEVYVEDIERDRLRAIAERLLAKMPGGV